jgi:hypothetical protein
VNTRAPIVGAVRENKNIKKTLGALEPPSDWKKHDRSIGRGPGTQRESPKVRGIAGHIEQAERGATRKSLQAHKHICPLLPPAMFFASYGFILVQVQVQVHTKRNTCWPSFYVKAKGRQRQHTQKRHATRAPAHPTPPRFIPLRTAYAPTSTHSNGFCVIWVCISSSSSSSRQREAQFANPHKHTSTFAHFYPQQWFLYHTGLY